MDLSPLLSGCFSEGLSASRPLDPPQFLADVITFYDIGYDCRAGIMTLAILVTDVAGWSLSSLKDQNWRGRL